MRCVLDTNVLVSALLSPRSKPRMAMDKVLKHGVILLSLATLTELSAVLKRAYFRRYLDEDDIHYFLTALVQESQLVNVDVQISFCRDAKDDKFLELAVSGQATHIITGDEDLIILHPFRDIQILAPAAFLEIFPSGLSST